MFRRKDCGVLTPRAHLDAFPYTTCSCDNTAALARCEHTWISLPAQRDRHVPAKRLRRSHAASTLGCLSVHNMFMRQHCCVRTLWAHLDPSHLDAFPCASRHVHAITLLRSHAVSTLGSLSVRRETCSGKKKAAFSRSEHTWMPFRAQTNRHVHATTRCVHTWIPQARRHVRATDCCVRTPQAHLDLSPCANRHVPSKRLLRSRAAPQDR